MPRKTFEISHGSKPRNVNLYLQAPLESLLRLEAEHLNVSRSEIVRRAIFEYFRQPLEDRRSYTQPRTSNTIKQRGGEVSY